MSVQNIRSLRNAENFFQNKKILDDFLFRKELSQEDIILLLNYYFSLNENKSKDYQLIMKRIETCLDKNKYDFNNHLYREIFKENLFKSIQMCDFFYRHGLILSTEFITAFESENVEQSKMLLNYVSDKINWNEKIKFKFREERFVLNKEDILPIEVEVSPLIFSFIKSLNKEIIKDIAKYCNYDFYCDYDYKTLMNTQGPKKWEYTNLWFNLATKYPQKEFYPGYNIGVYALMLYGQQFSSTRQFPSQKSEQFFQSLEEKVNILINNKNFNYSGLVVDENIGIGKDVLTYLIEKRCFKLSRKLFTIHKLEILKQIDSGVVSDSIIEFLRIPTRIKDETNEVKDRHRLFSLILPFLKNFNTENEEGLQKLCEYNSVIMWKLILKKEKYNNEKIVSFMFDKILEKDISKGNYYHNYVFFLKSLKDAKLNVSLSQKWSEAIMKNPVDMADLSQKNQEIVGDIYYTIDLTKNYKIKNKRRL